MDIVAFFLTCFFTCLASRIAHAYLSFLSLNARRFSESLCHSFFLALPRRQSLAGSPPFSDQLL
jgi:hypothetical protein